MNFILSVNLAKMAKELDYEAFIIQSYEEAVEEARMADEKIRRKILQTEVQDQPSFAFQIASMQLALIAGAFVQDIRDEELLRRKARLEQSHNQPSFNLWLGSLQLIAAVSSAEKFVSLLSTAADVVDNSLSQAGEQTRVSDHLVAEAPKPLTAEDLPSAIAQAVQSHAYAMTRWEEDQVSVSPEKEPRELELEQQSNQSSTIASDLVRQRGTDVPFTVQNVTFFGSFWTYRVLLRFKERATAIYNLACRLLTSHKRHPVERIRGMHMSHIQRGKCLCCAKCRFLALPAVKAPRAN